MTTRPGNLRSASSRQGSTPGWETVAALAGTAFSGILLILTAAHAGPLWRDEVNTLNLAQMPSLREFWNNLPFESFPPLWPLLVRLWSSLGWAADDAGIRVLGLLVGGLFLTSLWVTSRRMGGRAPTLSVALLGSLPSFIFIVGANRAYGLASCQVVFLFGMTWRLLYQPTKSRICLTGLTALLFVHCVYYDVVFLCAIFAGGAAVALRRRAWSALVALTGIGLISGASLAVYLPVIHRGSAYVPMIQDPLFDSSTPWFVLSDAVSARSSAQTHGLAGPQIWLWIALLIGGSILALRMQRVEEGKTENPVSAEALAAARRTDLALFCTISMLLGVMGYSLFLLRLQYLTQTWYYLVMLTLCAISLEGLLGANWPALRPWGLLRIGFMAALMAWNSCAAWEEAHTRRSNVDLIADLLGRNAAAGDLIVVQDAWAGITFERYYHGQARWVTVPPIDSHKVHRNDLVFEKMNQRDAMAPVLAEVTEVLKRGNSVWVVGEGVGLSPGSTPPPLPPGLPTRWWLQPYLLYWEGQVMTLLQDHALHALSVKIPLNRPVNHLENLPLTQFSGYKADGK